MKILFNKRIKICAVVLVFILGICFTSLQVLADDSEVPGSAEISENFGDSEISEDPLTVTSPSGGTSWVLGSTENISWSYGSYDMGDTVTIELLENGIAVEIIADSASLGLNGTGSYEWTLPADLTPEDGYQIRVTSNDYPNISAVSGNFALTEEEDSQASLTITSPSAGVDWNVLTTRNIEWSYVGNPGSTVKIELVKNGKAVQTIADNISIGSTGSGSYNWTIPEGLTSGEDYSVRITSQEDSHYSNTSDEFAIVSGKPLKTSMPAALASGSIGKWSDYVTITSLSGSGTSSSDPYLIQTAEDLAFMAKMVNSDDQDYTGAFYELTDDIDISAHYWMPIGTMGYLFDGSFDGGEKTITGLTIGSSSSPSELDYAGLFGLLDASANITDTRVINAKIYATYSELCIGGLAGYNWGGTIEDCYATGTISGKIGEAYAGGLVGGNEGSIINSYAAGSVESGEVSCVGGLVGYNVVGDISNCIAKCLVTGRAASYTGGGIGCNDYGGLVTNCYATGNVIGGNATEGLASYTGGFAGYNRNYILNCYATGDVTGGDAFSGHKSLVGGFVGKNYDNVSNCYATGDVAGGDNATLGGFTGGNDTFNSDVKLINAYWNSSAVQTVGGEVRQTNLLGNGESTAAADVTCGLTEEVIKGAMPDTGITYTSNPSGNTAVTDMTDGAFIDALNGGIGSLETGITYLTWRSGTGTANDGYPIFITDVTSTAHDITVQDDGNGTGSASSGSELQGNTVTLSAMPNSSYHFKEWQVISPSGLSITGNTFIMPDEAVTIKAIFEEDTQDNSDNGGVNNSDDTSGGSEEDDDDTIIRTWNELEDAIENSKEGDILTVDLNDKRTLPSEVLDQIKGKNITVVIEIDNYTWTINGKNVKSSSQDISLEVTCGNNMINSELVEIIADGHDFIEIQLNYDGKFNFTSTLRFYVGKSHAGKYADFYYFNPDENSLEFKGSYFVDENGYVNIDFSHASKYVLVFSDKSIAKEFSAGAGFEDNARPITESGIPYAIITVILTVGMIAYKRRKSCK